MGHVVQLPACPYDVHEEAKLISRSASRSIVRRHATTLISRPVQNPFGLQPRWAFRLLSLARPLLIFRFFPGFASCCKSVLRLCLLASAQLLQSDLDQVLKFFDSNRAERIWLTSKPKENPPSPYFQGPHTGL